MSAYRIRPLEWDRSSEWDDVLETIVGTFIVHRRANDDGYTIRYPFHFPDFTKYLTNKEARDYAEKVYRARLASALEPVDVEGIRKAVEDSLVQVSANVAKHVIQRDGWHADDKCFQVDLQAATERIVSEVAAILRREQPAAKDE